MQRLLLLLLIACGSSAKAPPAAVAPPPAPVSTSSPTAPVEVPKLRLPRAFLPTRYKAHLSIDPARSQFVATIEIAGTVHERTDVIWLHAHRLTIREAIGAGGPLTVTHHGEDLIALRGRAPFQPGPLTLDLSYTGQIDSTNTAGVFKQTVGNETYIYTQLEALYARRVFPCFDEPNVKVPWELSFTVPHDQVVVANTPVVTSERSSTQSRRVTFATTKPLPSYLVAFGIGPFEIVDAGTSKRGTPLRMVTLKGRAAEATYAVQTSAKILDAIEDYFGIPYPYEKLDMLTIPVTSGFGAMENAGLITYTERIMLMDPKRPAKVRQANWVLIAAHEIAHQWFGNLVTPMFWDDIWLNEGFAEWLALAIAARVAPEFRAGEETGSARIDALRSDALVSARKIRQPVVTVDDILTAFDAISYQKGASVLQMFEHYAGEEAFRRGVRAYLESRAWGNATSNDFVAAIAQGAGKRELDAAFRTFLDQAGAPIVTATVACNGGRAEVALSQQRYVPPGAPAASGGPWHVPMCVVFDRAGKRVEQCLVLDKPAATVALDTCPTWLLPNGSGRGYFRTSYTPAQVTALRDKAWPQLTWAERRALFVDVEDAARTGKLPLALALSLTSKMLAGGDRFTIGSALELSTSLDAQIPDDLRGNYEAWLRSQFGPLAKRTGLVPRDGDTLDVEQTRASLASAVAMLGRDPALRAQAVKLAARWRELPESTRRTVLAIAVDAKPAVFEQTLREVASEPDRSNRTEMYRALASVRDPARYKAALGVLLDPKLDIRETMWMPFYASTDALRDVARAFVRDNLDAILKRVPDAGTASPVAGYAQVFVTCKAPERDAAADYMRKKFEPLAGGKRVVQQAIEAMDQCIAKRALLEPELRAWLRR